MLIARGTSDEISICRGVKQGCPLSPTLFNLCIDPLIRRINHYKERCCYKFGQHLKEEYKAMQAYVDDVLLFSDHMEGLEFALNLIKDFVQFTKIDLNPGKCTAFRYNKGKEEFLSPVAIWDRNKKCDALLKWIEGSHTFKYLGIPLGKNKIGKLTYTDGLFSRVDLLLDRLKDGGLKINQTVNAIKTYILPKFDDLFHNSVLPLVQLKRMDKEIRATINHSVGGQPLYKALFYAD
jgi:hypothetical protein